MRLLIPCHIVEEKAVCTVKASSDVDGLGGRWMIAHFLPPLWRR